MATDDRDARQEGDDPTRAPLWLLVAAVVYLAGGLFCMRGVLPAPGQLLTGLAAGDIYRVVDRTDQQMVLATVTGNARRLIERPAALREEGQCYPLHHAYALGEHMFGEGFMAAPVLAATGNPVLSYNFVLLLRLWLPAMTMFCFVAYLTRNGWAALLAGFVYAFHHYRVTDPVHPFVHADMWAPLGLLAIHRLFERGGWLATATLSASVALCILESIYPLLAVALALTVYTLFLSVRFPDRITWVAPRIAVALAPSLLVVWFVLVPYLEMGPRWGVLSGASQLFGYARDFLPRGRYFPGVGLLTLATLGILDRLRGPRTTGAGDPRWALLAIAVLGFWSASFHLPIPGTYTGIPSPFRLLSGVVPGLDSARAMVLVKIGGVLGLGALAGYGALALVERLPARARPAVSALIGAAVLVEVNVRPVMKLVYAHVPPFEPYIGSLEGPARAFVEGIEGPVLDLPMHVGRIAPQAHYLHWAAYHGESAAVCYNSFASPMQLAVEEIARGLPDHDAAQAIAALGFRSIVVHSEQDPTGLLGQRFERQRSPLLDGPRRIHNHQVYELKKPGDLRPSFDALVAPSTPGSAVLGSDGGAIEFPFSCGAGTTYRHPMPMEPTDLRLVWTPANGAAPHVQSLRGLLPLAIAPGATARRAIAVPVDVGPGRYRVTLARSAAPDTVLSLADVRVEEEAAAEPLSGPEAAGQRRRSS